MVRSELSFECKINGQKLTGSTTSSGVDRFACAGEMISALEPHTDVFSGVRRGQQAGTTVVATIRNGVGAAQARSEFHLAMHELLEAKPGLGEQLRHAARARAYAEPATTQGQ